MRESQLRIGLVFTVLSLMGLLVPSPSAGQGAVLWQQNLNGTASGIERGNSVTADAQGNVVAAGRTVNSGTGEDFTVAKFDRNGTLLWQQNLDGTVSGDDEATSVTIDSQGDVVAAGVTQNGANDDFTVVKFDRNGTLLWQQTLNGTANGVDVARSVTVDHQGNVFAAGQTENTGSGLADFTVVKFDVNGTLLWQQDLNGSAINASDEATSVAVDHQGNVFAAGQTENIGTGFDFTVVKFDGNGTLLWQQHLNGTANGGVGSLDDASSVAVDHQGNAMAAGQTENSGTGVDFTVAKFDRNGTLLWQKDINGSANGVDDAASVAVDQRGDVVAAGLTQNSSTGFDFTVVKVEGNGTLLWQQDLNGTANGTDFARSVAVDQRQNVIAAGRTQDVVSGNDFTVAKFDRNGVPIWQQNLNGTANGFDDGNAVAVDSQGDVLAAGLAQNTTTGFDFAVVKLQR